MANVLDYVKKNGKKSFEELPYNEVDNVIFAALSYVDFDGIIENGYKKIRLEEAGKEFFKKYTKKELNNNILGIQAAIKIFTAIYKENRYKDLLVYNYSCKCDNTKQFSALFIDLDSKYTYVSFEGTDDLISGWKEDAQMTYRFPVPAQSEAIKYINRTITPFSKRKYIIGGHSKGGNLALVASMYANPLIKRKIVSVVMNDSPGLKKKQIESRYYKSILKRLKMIIPNYSVVGLMLRHNDNYHVVLSDKNGFMAHNVLSWQVRGISFIESKLSDFSKNLDQLLTKWLDTYNDAERKKFVEDLFDVFERAGIDSLLEIKASTLPSLMSILRESKKISPISKQMIRELVKFLIDFFKQESTNFIQSKIPW